MKFRRRLRSGLAAMGATVVLGSGGATAQEWVRCAAEGEYCRFAGTKITRHGGQGEFRYQVHTDGIACRNDIFGGLRSGNCSIYVSEAELDDWKRLEDWRDMRAQLQERDQRIEKLEAQVIELRDRAERSRGGSGGDNEELRQAREKTAGLRERMQAKNERIRDLADRVRLLEARLKKKGLD